VISPQSDSRRQINHELRDEVSTPSVSDGVSSIQVEDKLRLAIDSTERFGQMIKVTVWVV
jgi:hypothetical protein